LNQRQSVDEFTRATTILAGAGVVDRVHATLEFPEPGRVAGNASCNRFFGSVEATEQMIKIGSLGSTKMACAEAVNNQEIQARRAARHLRRQLRYRSGPSVRSRSGTRRRQREPAFHRA